MNVIVILCDTLRRDHVGAYNGGRALNQCWSPEAPDWPVPTPNMDRLARRGTVFTNCFCGSTPCMPARRDIYTGRLEFLERGWGPLEEDDRDLPRQVSGPPNQSVSGMPGQGHRVSYLVSDHFHLWEQGSGNYHMGYTGFEWIRGKEADAWRTDPVAFDCPEDQRNGKCERHWRNVHFLRRNAEDEENWFSPRVFRAAADWLEANHRHPNFYLHIDCFDPHEPLDPPEHLLKLFDPEGYRRFAATNWPYAPWRDHLSPEEFRHVRARYAANVVLVDRALGRLLEVLDRLDLWRNTLVVLTTDHGTFNGDHGRVGKLQTHEFDAVGHIPFILVHPTLAHGETRRQLAQLVDLYPTVLAAVDRPLPDPVPSRPLHGINLLPALADARAPTREFALMGQWGQSVSITDGDWILHQAPAEGNQPLNWYGACQARFMPAALGDYDGRCRPAIPAAPLSAYWWQTPTWLSDKRNDMNERVNLAEAEPSRRRELQGALRDQLLKLKAPSEQLDRLGIRG